MTAAENPDWRCVVCRRLYAKNEPDRTCSECRRHLAYGVLVELIVDSAMSGAAECDALNALATVMGTATRLRRQFNKDLRDEQRAAQRDARDAYADGQANGRASGGEW